VSIYSQKDDEKMSKGFMSRMTRPEEGERGLGASHRRGGTGRASYRRPPEGSHLRNFPEGKRGASATSKAPGVERKVESMRDKGAQRAASGKLHIDDGCMGGGGSLNVFIKELKEADEDAFYAGTYSTGISNKGFDTTRSDVFRYCFNAYKIDNAYLHKSYPNRDKDEFTGWRLGNKYTVFMANRNTQDEVLHTFVHELGHTLLGVLDGPGSGNDHQSSYNPKHCDQSKCVMYQASDGTRKGEYWHFCDHCWKEMHDNGLELL